LAGFTLSNIGGGAIPREQGERNREHGEHLFPLVFPEHIPGTLWGKLIAGLKLEGFKKERKKERIQS